MSKSSLDAVVRSMVLSALPEARIEELASRFDVRALSAGTIVSSGQGVESVAFVVASGAARTFHQAEGARPVSTAILGIGDIFGDVPGFDRRGTEWLECLGPCEVLRISGTVLRSLLLEEPRLAVAVLARLYQQLTAVEHRLVASSRPVAARVAGTLLELAERFGVSAPDQIRVLLSLTHAQIASLAATRRETVTKVLGSLREQGIAEVDRHEVRVFDQATLRAVADGATLMLRPAVNAVQM